MENLGTEHIKSVMKFAADARNQGADVMADKKVTWIEAVSFLPLIMRTPDLFANFKQTVAEIKDATHPEREDLEKYAIEVLNIASEEVEAFIAKCCDWIILTVELFDSGSKLV